MYTETIPPRLESKLRKRYGIPSSVEITFAWEYECEVSPEDSFCDDTAVKWVRKQMDKGNDAAWFRACVTVSDGDAEGRDYLSGCSYRSFRDFMRPDDYFGDMVGQAFAEYQREAARLSAKYATATT